MTMKKILSIAAAGATLLLGLAACQKEQSSVAKATLLDYETLEVSAKDVDDATLSVISDGEWTITEYPDWVSVSPLSGGAGETLVTISISDNLDEDEVDFPREGKIVLGGTRLSSKATLTISQAGDRYKGAPLYTLETITGAKDSTTVSIKNATAILETSKYLLITDGDGFALTDAHLSLDEKATVKGVKTTVYGITLISEADILDPERGDEYPATAEDITAALDDFTSENNGKYVSVEGVSTVPGNETVTVKVSEQQNKVSVLFPSSDFNFAKLTNHKVLLEGYAFRDTDSTVALVAKTVTDEGMTRAQDLVAQWKFADHKDENALTFTGNVEEAISDADKKEGDGGKYIAANVGDAKIKYINVDKTNISGGNNSGGKESCPARRLTSGGAPNTNGGWKGDYWLFDVNLSKTYAAGSTVSITMTTKASGSGLKYWVLEIFDGGEWTPMKETVTEEITSANGNNKATVTYNFAQSNNASDDISVSYTLASSTSENLQIRYRAAENFTAANAYLSKLGTGWHRLEGSPKVVIAYDE